MKLSLPNITGSAFKPDKGILQSGLEASRKSARLRMILPMHRTQDALVQRMINFLQPGTYIRPHQHPMDHAIETVILLQGGLSFFIFDDEGMVREHYALSDHENFNLVDIEPRTWHSFIVTKPDTVIFEAKRGPYDPHTDKIFADWSPPEGSPESSDYILLLEQNSHP